MARRLDLVIVGMGSGGMVAAELATTLGLRVAIVERGRVGGDCLWTGCVPSKALLASAKAAHTMRTAHRYGLPDVDPEIDTVEVWKQMRAVRQQIATTDDDPARFEAMGAAVVRGHATLVGPHTVRVEHSAGGRIDLDARFILLCTGSRPTEPEIPGLREVGALTSETVFELDRAPSSICVIGGGPIAVEMAQAFCRLGIRTTVLQKGDAVLAREEPELVDVLTEGLRGEGVDVRTGVDIDRVDLVDGLKVVNGRAAPAPSEARAATAGPGRRATMWRAEELFVAVGRRPSIEGLGLEDVGIETGPKGVVVDDRGRTTLPWVYAAGDLAGRHLFTHSAGYEAVRAVRDLAFPGRGEVRDLIPWCTFTDPELAHVGLTIAEARERHGERVEVWRMALDHSDRARAERATDGRIIIVTANNKVVGAHILGPGAGELIHEPALAISQGLRLSDLAFVHVYPTLSSSIGQLAADAAIQSARRLAWTRRLTWTKRLTWTVRRHRR